MATRMIPIPSILPSPRFSAYAQAVAEYVTPRVRGPHFFTPINEITFFAFIWSFVCFFERRGILSCGVGSSPLSRERLCRSFVM
jgi:hypothetical protein